MSFEEFEAIYAEHSPSIYTYLLRTTGSREDAMELTQETFFRLWKNRKKLGAATNVRAWLFKVASNLAVSMFRKRKRRFFIEDLNVEPFVESFAQEEYDRVTLNGKMQELLNELPPGQRAVVWLKVVEGLSHNEIAELLKISVGTSKSQFNRGITKLRKLVANLEGDA